MGLAAKIRRSLGSKVSSVSKPMRASTPSRKPTSPPPSRALNKLFDERRQEVFFSRQVEILHERK